MEMLVLKQISSLQALAGQAACSPKAGCPRHAVVQRALRRRVQCPQDPWVGKRKREAGFVVLQSCPRCFDGQSPSKPSPEARSTCCGAKKMSLAPEAGRLNTGASL